MYYLNDLPLRAIDVISSCSEVFIERYTNLNDITFIEKLKKITGKNIEVIGREEVESSLITDKAVDKDIALLIPGDPLAATTHFSLVEECYQKNIAVKIIHASSIFSAVGETGLSIYKFGGTTSIPIYTENFHPESFFDTIEKNINCDYHTLVLLEVRDEKNFVKPIEAMKILKTIEEKNNKNIIKWDSVIVLSQLGSDSQTIKIINEKDINNIKPPCAVIIPGKLNQNELEAIEFIRKSSGTA